MRRGMWFGGLAIALVTLLGTVLGPARAADETTEPFPVDKSRILREGNVVYLVEGRMTIPRGVEVSCQKNVIVRGVGEGATIVVEGSLQGHGVGAREIIFENVMIEPAAKCEDLHLDMVIFRSGGGIRTGKEKATDGKLFLENTRLTDGAVFDVEMVEGSVDLSSFKCDTVAKLVALDREGSPNKLKVKIRGSQFTKGLELRNADDVTVRINTFNGERVTFVDCGSLIFDGNKVTAKRVEIVQQKAGRQAKTKLQKCDFYCDEISVWAPLEKGKSDVVTVDKCYFKGETDEDAIHEKFLRDGRDLESNGATFKLKKVNERPLELAGAIER